MGTDIHAFVEYKVKNEGKTSWESFSADEILLERDYTMFNIIAEVRDEAPNSFSAKGKIPLNELSVHVRHRRTYLIGVDCEETGKLEWGDCTLKDAKGYQKKNRCRIHYLGRHPWRVDSPHLHTDTWLTFSEYEQVLHYYKDYEKEMPPIGYLAVYEVMKVYENAGYETRLVIFFDN